MSDVTVLPDEIRDWIEEVTGGILLAQHRIAGGGTRQGWFVDVGDDDAATRELFLRYSPVPPSRAFHRLAVEAEVVAALGAAGATVPAVHAVHPAREAVLLDRVPGRTWFSQIRDPAEQLSVAQDFISHLAFVHRLDPAALSLPSLGPPRSAAEHTRERIADLRRRATLLDGTIDPLTRISIDWLDANVPDYDGPVVLVQGDTGPGNFLYQDGKITAVLDWELSHFGDPMDDIAWLSLRTVQDTFTHFPDRLAEYTAQSGHEIDADRVWYHRVFAETNLATLRVGVDDDQPYDVGNRIMYDQLHRRLWLEALDHVMGLDLARPSAPSAPDPEPWQHLYHDLLQMFRTMAPLIDDPLATRWNKGAARAVRYLKEIDASGRVVARQELTEIAEVVGARPATLSAGRAALDDAHRAGNVPDGTYVRLLWNRTMRNDELMRTASGALRERTWPPLS